MEEEQSVWASEEQRRICKELAEHYRAIISLLGDDPDREGLRKTPERTAKAMMQLTRGYRQSAQEIISSAVFEHTGSRIVVVRDIEFYSFCEHHLLPFFGKVHVGYIPSGGIVGLSKVARLVEVFARRFAGASYGTDLSKPYRYAFYRGGDGRRRSSPPLYADARSREARSCYGYIR